MLQLSVEIHGEEAMQAFGARLGQVCGGHGVPQRACHRR